MENEVISTSLLKNIKIKRVPSCFSLGMDDWLEPHLVNDSSTSELSPTSPSTATAPKLCAMYAPPSKKAKLDLKPSQRFVKLTDKQLQELSKPCIPKKTLDATNWALNNFKSWMEYRNKQPGTEKCPENLLLEMEPSLLDK